MNTVSAPAWSLAGRLSSKKFTTTPGPSDYDPSLSTFRNPPTVKIGRSSKSYLSKSPTPGPGSYETSNSTLQKSGPKIGNSKRSHICENSTTPGPGSYDIRLQTPEGPKYSMPGRSSKLLIKQIPGPGCYEHHPNDFTTKDRAPTYRIGTEPKTSRPNSAFPGPGTYNPDTQLKGPQWKFGSQSKDNLHKSDCPGPGTYTIPVLMSQQGYTMLSRKIKSEKNFTPGPGAYNPVGVRPKSPSWRIGKADRDEFKNRKDHSPGPGTYSPLLEVQSSSAVFGTAEKTSFVRKNNNPGPGEYHGEDLEKGPAYTMRPKTANRTLDKGPGPGHYDPNASCESFRWTIGKQQRPVGLAHKTTGPGPGQYDSNKSIKGPKWGFGTESKSKKTKQGSPGPGTYNIYSTVSNLPTYARVSKTKLHIND